MTTFAMGSIVFEVKCWTLYSSVNFRPSSGVVYCWNSWRACFPRLRRSTRNSTRWTPMDFGVFDEAVYRGDRRERLPTPCRHLNECPWAVVSKRGLQMHHSSPLRSPQSFALEGR